jgi:hypothetical protein
MHLLYKFKPDKEFCILYAEDQYWIDYHESCKEIPYISDMYIENYIQRNFTVLEKTDLVKCLCTSASQWHGA